MAKYTFKYWFEWGCREDWCPCLWANDDYTRDVFNDGISCTNIHELPISKELIQFLCELGIEHDNALDWDSPSNPLLWTKEEEEAFYRKAEEGCRRLQEELGEDYEIINCVKNNLQIIRAPVSESAYFYELLTSTNF